MSFEPGFHVIATFLSQRSLSLRSLESGFHMIAAIAEPLFSQRSQRIVTFLLNSDFTSLMLSSSQDSRSQRSYGNHFPAIAATTIAEMELFYLTDRCCCDRWKVVSMGAFTYTGPTGQRPLGLTKGKWNASEPKLRAN